MGGKIKKKMHTIIVHVCLYNTTQEIGEEIVANIQYMGICRESLVYILWTEAIIFNRVVLFKGEIFVFRSVRGDKLKRYFLTYYIVSVEMDYDGSECSILFGIRQVPCDE